MNCPNCENKVYEGAYNCAYCGLKTKHFNNVSNAKAKNILLHGKLYEKEEIIYTNKLTDEICRKSLILKTIFGGWFGIHNIYVGNYFKGFLSPICLVIGFVLGLFEMKFSMGAYFFVGLLMAIPLLIWIWDIMAVILRRFKIPVALKDDTEFAKVKKVGE